MSSCIALIVAAGSGQRFGAEQPKQYLDLAGQPVLRRTVEAFRRHPKVSAVRVVINPAFRDLYDAAVAGLDLPEPVAGGASRQDSVRNGLEALADSAPGLVLIHDAARPLIDSDTINAVIAALDTHPAALAAVPVADTLKRGDDGLVAGTVDRSDIPAAWFAPGAPLQRALRVTHAIAAKSADFRFAEPWKGLETLPRAGTVIGWSEGAPVTTPYDNCVLIMPSTANLRPGVTVVRLAQPIT